MVMLFLCRYSFFFTNNAILTGQRTSAMNMPFWYVYASLAMSWLIMAVIAVKLTLNTLLEFYDAKQAKLIGNDKEAQTAADKELANKMEEF